jgi:hypothetical protein
MGRQNDYPPAALEEPTRPSGARARTISIAVLLTAVLFGGAARLASADWGLPYTFHPDEKGFVVWETITTEWRGLVEDDWRPRINTYGPLLYETAIALKWLTFGGPESARAVASRFPDGWRYLLGAFDHGQTTTASYDFRDWFLTLRLFSALLGSLSILLLGLAAWKLEGPRAGAFTAVLAAACVGLLQVSHYFTSDALVVFELAMLVHASALFARGGGLSVSVYAGIAAGMLAATKMPGLAALPAVVLAIGADDPFPTARTREAELGRIVRRTAGALVSPRFLLTLLVGVAVLRVIHPWLFTDPHAYFYDVPQNRSGLWHIRVHLQETEFDFYDWRFTFNDTTPFVYHLTHPLVYALGTPLLVASFVALGVGFFRLRPIDRIAIVVALPTLFLVGNWGVKTIRYVMPMVPGLLLAAGPMLARATERAPGAPFSKHVVRRGLAWLVAGWTVAYGVAFVFMFTEPDSRVAAGHYVAEHAASGDVVVVGPESAYTAPLGTNDDIVGVEAGLRPDVRVRKLFEGRPAGRDLGGHLDRVLADARFLVLDDFYLRRAAHSAIRDKAPEHARFFNALLAGRMGFRRVATFRRRPTLGPLVWNEDEDEILAVSFDHVGVEVWERTGVFQNPLAPPAPALAHVRARETADAGTGYQSW